MSPFARRALTSFSVVACMAGVAACGSDKSSSSSSSSASTSSTSSKPDAGLAAAKAAIADQSGIPNSIPVTVPLKSKPPKKTVAWLEPSVPAGQTITPGFKDATKALGWDLKIIPLNPAQPGPSVQQAIDAKVDYIGISGESEALYAPQLKAAKAAGIPVVSSYDNSPATGKDGNGIYLQSGGTSTAQNDGKYLADYAIATSNGKAQVAAFNITTYPNLVTQAKAFEAEINKNCAGCKFSTVAITLDQLGKGEIPQVVASYIQSHPKTDYLYFTFSNPPTGVASALNSAGLLKGRKIFGLDFNKERLQGVIDGKETAWTGLPKQYSAWLSVDAMARLAEGMPLTPDEKAITLPHILVDTPAEAKSHMALAAWDGPTGFREDFQKLWHVG